ncbi:MAG: glycosyl hydrolase 53 family protein, partial [Planctomycetota bacterium]
QVGISYYPKWSRCSIAELGQTIRRLRQEFGKEVIIVETAYPWTTDGNDSAGNILEHDSLVPEYPATLSGQKRFLIELTQTVIANDGMGVVYWEPAWVSSDAKTRWGKGSHWENNAFFDFKQTNAHTGFDFFTHPYVEPKPFTFQFEAESEFPGETVYFWSDIFNDKAFVVPLTRTGKTYEFTMLVMPNQEFRFMLFKDNTRKQPIIMNVNGKAVGSSAGSVMKAIIQH